MALHYIGIQNIYSSDFSFNKDDLLSYMQQALDNVPERDSSSSSRNTSGGVHSSTTGSATPTEELLSAAVKPAIQSYHSKSVASKGVGSSTLAPSSSHIANQRAHSDFDLVKKYKEEEHYFERERHRTKSSDYSGRSGARSRSTSSHKGRVSFESDKSSRDVPPLDLPDHTSSANITPVSSTQTTPMESPRYTFEQVSARSKVSSQASNPQLSRVRHHYRSSSAPRSVEKPNEIPVVKSKSSTTMQSHITTREVTQVRPSSRQKKYYDLDFQSIEGAHAVSKVPGKDRSHSSRYVPSLNSPSYLQTPEVPRDADTSSSGLRGTNSFIDVNQIMTEIESVSRSELYNTASLLEESHESRPSALKPPIYKGSTSSSKASSNASREKYQRKSRVTDIVMSDVPSKSQSLPNVADAESEQDWTFDSRHNITNYDIQVPREIINKYTNYHVATERQESGESLLSDNDHYHHPHVTSRHRSHRPPSPNETYTIQSTMSSHVSGPHHTVSTQVYNQDADISINSDTDSMKSFVSSSSITSFQHAINARINSGSATRASSGSRIPPVRVTTPSASSDYLQQMFDGAPENIQRPIALVTRHTQVPSPGPGRLSRSRHADHR